MLRINIKHFFLSLSFWYFLWPQSIFAASPPNLISPLDSSQIEKSPKFTWEYSGECIQTGSCFVVEVDNNSDFSSPEKSTYTKNLSYSPQGLTEGTWHWRVKAKDKSEKWSDWSQVYKFSLGTLAAASPTLNSQASSEPTPKPQNQAAFEIKNLPSEIDSNQYFEAVVSLSLPANPGQTFYLKGAFKKGGSSNYFGQTYSDGWVENSEKYSKQLKITTDSKGAWEGKIKAMPDPEDSGFEGTGDYIFKVARYTDSGSGPTWSNEINIKITAALNPSPSASVQNLDEASEEEEKKPDITASLVKDTPRNYEIKIASVAGAATISNNTSPEPQTKVLGQTQVNWFLIILGLAVLSSGSGFVFYKLKKEKMHAKSFN